MRGSDACALLGTRRIQRKGQGFFHKITLRVAAQVFIELRGRSVGITSVSQRSHGSEKHRGVVGCYGGRGWLGRRRLQRRTLFPAPLCALAFERGRARLWEHIRRDRRLDGQGRVRHNRSRVRPLLEFSLQGRPSFDCRII